ncbi:transglycosylase SLT domain-containing protein [Fulvimarina sp. 2208YS6-2-32]|uniref:Transglycosylase SLT domain-containing protein n=1 Tax=Fulvimarina uroteuthidis TaxID=3098149 RepID=A0ABU5I7L8_9HYPH|nr:transglycosylase SLT domain-containing protein [Fulvimarina sp. 2208YS6-2-32]MDY8111102.1 transglycosylase SLT domain-containing protein [Fulvimarina sp. 2208YS6-2-32]
MLRSLRMPLLFTALFALPLSACVPNAATVLESAAPLPVARPADAPSPVAVAAIQDEKVFSRDREIAAREIAKASEKGTVSGSAAIDGLIAKHAKANDIPVELAFGVVRVESRYNPRARGAGVYGLSQIKPATARSLGFSGSASDLLDADTNLRYGMKYLKGAWDKADRDVCRTAMKYKGGHRATRMTRSASSYCSKVKAHMAEIAKRGGVPAARALATMPAETAVAGAPPAKAMVTMVDAVERPGAAAPTLPVAADAIIEAPAKPATTDISSRRIPVPTPSERS